MCLFHLAWVGALKLHRRQKYGTCLSWVCFFSLKMVNDIFIFPFIGPFCTFYKNHIWTDKLRGYKWNDSIIMIYNLYSTVHASIFMYTFLIKPLILCVIRIAQLKPIKMNDFFNDHFCYFIDNRTDTFSDDVGPNPGWPKLLIYSFVNFEDERANFIFVFGNSGIVVPFLSFSINVRLSRARLKTWFLKS